jgi:hypothetical protein
MPAHNEASTEQDRSALADRIYETLLRTPSYSTFFLLADSPSSQRENELEVIRRVSRKLRADGFGYLERRLVLEEYRHKPETWRNKCGSLLAWLQRYGDEFEYMFVLDADSSLPEPDPRQPETCDIVERMTLALRDDPTLSIVQASIHVRDFRTPWGWLQSVNARIGSDYYFRVFAHVYGRTAPCYGHNCLIRVRDFALLARNTLSYTSHDHIDSADLAAAGCGCVLTDAATTYEQAEETLPGWLTRECRWSRGNGQWLTYLLRKRALPAGASVYLLLGIMQYAWSLLASLLIVSAVVLVHQGVPLLARPNGLSSRLLVGLVLFALIVPKIVATRSQLELLASIASSILLGPSLALYQGFAFVLGAFGSKWVPRGARDTGFGLPHMTATCATFFPSMILGLALWGLLSAAPAGDNLLLSVMVAGMVLSPLTALLLSWPVFGGAGRGAPRKEGLDSVACIATTARVVRH